MAMISLRTDPELDRALLSLQKRYALTTRTDVIRKAVLDAERRQARLALQEEELRILRAQPPDPAWTAWVERSSTVMPPLDDTDWEAMCGPFTS